MSSVEKHKRDSFTLNRGRLLILFTGVLWSLGGVFIKSLELPPVVIAFYRSIFASLLFSLFVTRSGWRLGFPLLVSVASYTATMSFFVWANKLTTAANAIVLQYTAPIFVFLFIRLWFREPISGSNLLTLFLGMVGMTIIFSGSRGQQDLQGVTVALFSGIVFSIYMVNLRFLKGINPLALTFVNNLVCSLALLPLAVTQLALSTDQLLALAAMGVVQLGIPYFLFSKGLETISLQEASLIVLVEPVLNPVWVVLIVGGATLVGGGVILFSLALRYLRLLTRRGSYTE
jgi:drug/metabolite transporter (DMT)-like permease